MAVADIQQQRLLHVLRNAAGRAVTLSELRAAGIGFPATVVGELELGGYNLERVYEHGRLSGIRL